MHTCSCSSFIKIRFVWWFDHRSRNKLTWRITSLSKQIRHRHQTVSSCSRQSNVDFICGNGTWEFQVNDVRVGIRAQWLLRECFSCFRICQNDIDFVDSRQLEEKRLDTWHVSGIDEQAECDLIWWWLSLHGVRSRRFWWEHSWPSHCFDWRVW